MVGSKLVQIQMKVPDNKIKILDVSVDFEKFEDGRYKIINSYQKENEHELCTPDTLNTMFGILGCGQVSYYTGRAKNDPNWIFTGPSKASIMFQKTDSFDGLIFKYSWNSKNISKTRGSVTEISLVYDTPGSQTNRKTMFMAKYDEKKSFFDLDITIPALDFIVKLKYDWVLHRKVLSVNIFQNGNRLLEFTQSVIRYRSKFELISKFLINSEELMDWKGTIFVKPGTYSLDATLKAQFHDQVIISADIVKGFGGRFKTYGMLNSTNLKSKFSIFTRMEDHVGSIRGEFDYQYNDSLDKFSFSGKSLDRQVNGRFIRSFNADLNVSNS